MDHAAGTRRGIARDEVGVDTPRTATTFGIVNLKAEATKASTLRLCPRLDLLNPSGNEPYRLHDSAADHDVVSWACHQEVPMASPQDACWSCIQSLNSWRASTVVTT